MLTHCPSLFPRQPRQRRHTRAIAALVAIGATLIASIPRARGEASMLATSFAADAHAKTWTLSELAGSGFNLPTDWGDFNYLVLDLKASSPEMFFLTIRDGDRWLRLKIWPMQGPWIRACIPLQYYRRPNRKGNDMAALGNKVSKTFFLGMAGTYGPLDHVTALGVEMPNVIGDPTLEIRDIRLARKSPGDALLDPGPVVDKFGQWIPDEWPGKAKSLEQLRADWDAEDRSLPASTAEAYARFGYGKFGGDTALPRLRSSGFFRTEKVGKQWWLVDPEGMPFFSVAANGVGWWDGTLVHATTWAGMPFDGREEMFAELPPDTVRPPSGLWSQKTPQVSFRAWNLQRRYGGSADWEEQWRDTSFRRMADWGLNTVGNWSEQSLYQAKRAPYVFALYGWGNGTEIMGMPDIHADGWLSHVDAQARKLCLPRRDDPWIIGYFLGNEPPYPGRESGVVDAILAGPDTATRHHLEKWLADGDTPERRITWIYASYKTFLDGIIAAVRRYDTNHLILGMRYASNPPVEMLRASSGFDVVSINAYSEVPKKETLDNIARLLDKPVLIGEYHFGAPGRGLAGGLVVVKDQRARGVAYEYYMEHAAENPAIVGAHWFQWADQPSTGRLDGERFNIGFVDVTDRPYPDLIEAMRRTHKRLGAIHAGKLQPVTERPERQ